MNKCEQIVAVSGSGAVLTCDNPVKDTTGSLCEEHKKQTTVPKTV